MTDIEYDIINEIYFITQYSLLKEESSYSDEELRDSLIGLAKKGWIRVYASVDEESEIDIADLESNYQSYFYLAAKKGLFEHNVR